MVRKNLTGAHYGLNSWLQQRITAVIMLICTLGFVGLVCYLSCHVNASFASWKQIFHHTWVKMIVEIFVVSLLIHAWVGVRDVIMDYLHCAPGRLTFYILAILWLIASFIYSIEILW